MISFLGWLACLKGQRYHQFNGNRGDLHVWADAPYASGSICTIGTDRTGSVCRPAREEVQFLYQRYMFVRPPLQIADIVGRWGWFDGWFVAF